MKKFTNKSNKTHKNFYDYIKWKLTSTKVQWPKSISVHNFDTPPEINDSDKFRISFIGHATFLIQIQGLNILTDPIWSLRIGPSFFNRIFGPKRVSAPGIKFHNLPKIDAVLISHNHYDHLDIATLKKLWLRDKPVFIMPLKNDHTLRSHISEATIKTLNWGESILINKISIHLEAAQHWSGRGFFDHNKSLWGSYIVNTSSGSVCFIGDTGYDAAIFKEIANKHGSMHVSLIPIGAYEPRWFMKDVHLNPEEAIMVHQDLQSRHSIAMHFDTFHLADDGFGQASLELENARKKHKISHEAFITPEVGNFYWF